MADERKTALKKVRKLCCLCNSVQNYPPRKFHKTMSEGTQGKWPLKVVSAGHVRSGTASLSIALDKLGYGPVFHWMTSPREIGDISWGWFYENLPKIDKGKDQDVSWNEFGKLIKCHSIMDTPVYHYWKHIYKQNPNIKVIISVRDSFDIWYKSVTKMYYNIMLAPWWFPIVSFLDNIHYVVYYGYDPNDKWRSISSHGISKPFGGWKSFLNDKILTEIRYNQYIEDVKSVVPKDQLLIFNVTQGWEPLCKFLNIPKDKIPKEEFPFINKTDQITKFVRELRLTILKHFLLFKVLPCLILFGIVMIRRRMKRHL